MHARITVNGAALLADPAGGVYWPDEKLLVVADLHLEKGSAYARGGQFLPPYDTRATLDRLTALLRRYRPARVACLGDSFHDDDGPARLDRGDRALLGRFTGEHEWIWIAGNHDPAPPPSLGGRVVAELAVGGLALRHQPAGSGERAGEICGHFHPRAAVATRGRRVSGACFVTDGRRLVMPALGAYAGGLDALDPAIRGLFGRGGFRVLMLGRDRLHLFPHTGLERIAGARVAP
jgi:DNA ligase-associated metallophosphoesterase